jgi:hypothetical protein
MDDHAGGLVHDKKVGVLVKDLERDILGSRAGGRLRRLLFHAEEVAGLHFAAAPDWFAPQGDAARFHKGLDFGSGESGEIFHQDHVDALAGILVGGLDFMDR